MHKRILERIRKCAVLAREDARGETYLPPILSCSKMILDVVTLWPVDCAFSRWRCMSVCWPCEEGARRTDLPVQDDVASQDAEDVVVGLREMCELGELAVVQGTSKERTGGRCASF